MSAAGGILDGLRVIEFAAGIPGPLAGRRLADLGADVTKIEDAAIPDWLRHAEPKLSGSDLGATFAALNRGKTVRTVDLDGQSGRRDFAAAVSDADVLLCDRPAEWLHEVGLGVQLNDVAAGCSSAVWVLLSAYGALGPMRAEPGSELTCQAATGYTTYIGQRGDPPSRLGTNVGETGTGIFAVQAVLAARYAALRGDGAGQLVTVSTTQSLLSMASIQIAAQAFPDDYLGPRVGGAFYPPQRGWNCADGQITFAFGGALGKDGRPGWKNFIAELRAEWMFDDPRFDHAGVNTTGLGVDVELVRADYERLFQSYSADFLVNCVRRHGGSAAKYQTLVEALDHPQSAALGILHAIDEPPGRAKRFPGWNRAGTHSAPDDGPGPAAVPHTDKEST